MGRAGYQVDLPGLTARVRGPARLIHELPRVFPRAGPQTPSASGTTVFQIDDQLSDGAGYRLTRDGVVLWTTADADEVLPLLEWAITTAGVEHLGQRYVLFHAGAVAAGDRGLVLPGASGSGKTTLVAGLLRAGFRYLSDEVAVIDASGPCLLPFPKSLCVKPGARAVLGRLYPSLAAAPARHRFGDQRVWYLAPDQAAWPTAPVPVRYVVLPRYAPEAPTRLDPLPRSAAVRPLLEQSFNARRLGIPAVANTLGMLRTVDTYALAVSDLGRAVELLRRLVGV